MDFDPSACSVSLATAQSSPNFDHLNLKCCSSSADLAPVMEPVAMAKDLNVSVDHLHLTADVAECVPHTHTQDSSIAPCLKDRIPKWGTLSSPRQPPKAGGRRGGRGGVI